jgi:glycosyltransferase involved in cell wall biosynthesis
MADNSSVRPLSILFTNNTLAERAGSEIWVRDVARALVARRHQPIAFSLVHGTVARELRAATVPVVADLADVAATPDVIHGHHHLETLVASLHFPTVPIVHFCHGWLPWEERPLKHPSIVRYVAVDETCLQRLTQEEGIPPDRVELVPNFVDLDRFQPRGPLPQQPRRALVFSNYAAEGGYVAVIREALRRAGVELAVAGSASGRVLDQPEHVLRDYDLVFAKGRAALEALAVGCSVIVTDVPGAGPLVTPEDFPYLRSRNFGIRLLQHPHTVDWYSQQLAAYRPDHAKAVQALVRRTAGLSETVDRLLDIYQHATTSRVTGPLAADGHALAAQRAAARHLWEVLPTLKGAAERARHRAQTESELRTALDLQTRLIRERDQSEQRAAAADLVSSDLRRQVGTLERTLRDSRELVETYQRLAVVRFRDALLRAPLLGRAVRPVVRALGRMI